MKEFALQQNFWQTKHNLDELFTNKSLIRYVIISHETCTFYTCKNVLEIWNKHLLHGEILAKQLSNHFIPNFVNSVNSAYQILILCDYYENLFYSQMIAYRNPFLVIGLLLYPLKTSENLTSIPPEIIRKPMVLW